jgi:hypothetical protein
MAATRERYHSRLVARIDTGREEEKGTILGASMKLGGKPRNGKMPGVTGAPKQAQPVALAHLTLQHWEFMIFLALQ